MPSSSEDLFHFQRHLIFDDKRKAVFCFVPKVTKLISGEFVTALIYSCSALKSLEGEYTLALITRALWGRA